MSTETNLRLVRRAVTEIWNGKDLDLADLLFAPAYVNHGGLIPDLVTGPEGIKFAAALQRTAFPSLRILEQTLVAEEDLVELTWRVGLRPASGERTSHSRCLAEGTTLIRCIGNQMAESWTTWSCPPFSEVAASRRRSETSKPLSRRTDPSN